MQTTSSALVQLVAAHVQLHESKKVLKGNCPFHPDQTASLMVSPTKEIFKCFGCGLEGGEAEFNEALRNVGR